MNTFKFSIQVTIWDQIPKIKKQLNKWTWKQWNDHFPEKSLHTNLGKINCMETNNKY